MIEIFLASLAVRWSGCTPAHTLQREQLPELRSCASKSL